MRNSLYLWGHYAPLMLFIIGFVLILDQSFKGWMLYGLELKPGDYITLTPFFDIVMVWNKGISYGLFQQNSAWGRWTLIGVGAITLIILWIWANLRAAFYLAFGASLVIGGGLGNMIDRIIYGAVADFFSFHAFGFYWYVFNIADVAITFGFISMLYDLFRSQKA